MRFGLVRSISKITFLFVLAVFPSLAMAIDVPKWSTYDIGFTASASYSNGYAAGPSFTATFTGPGGITQSVSGFWDGSQQLQSPLHSHRGRNMVVYDKFFRCGAQWPDRKHQCHSGECRRSRIPPHRLRTTPSSFVWDDGTRNFMWGQTYYDIVMTANGERQLEDGRGQFGGVRDEQVRSGSLHGQRWRHDRAPRTIADAQPYTGSVHQPRTATASTSPTGRSSTKSCSTGHQGDGGRPDHHQSLQQQSGSTEPIRRTIGL